MAVLAEKTQRASLARLRRGDVRVKPPTRDGPGTIRRRSKRSPAARGVGQGPTPERQGPSPAPAAVNRRADIGCVLPALILPPPTPRFASIARTNPRRSPSSRRGAGGAVAPRRRRGVGAQGAPLSSRSQHNYELEARRVRGGRRDGRSAPHAFRDGERHATLWSAPQWTMRVPPAARAQGRGGRARHAYLLNFRPTRPTFRVRALTGSEDPQPHTSSKTPSPRRVRTRGPR